MLSELHQHLQNISISVLLRRSARQVRIKLTFSKIIITSQQTAAVSSSCLSLELEVCSHVWKLSPSPIFSTPIFTVRNSSCGKVMFLQVSVCPRWGGVSSPLLEMHFHYKTFMRFSKFFISQNRTCFITSLNMSRGTALKDCGHNDWPTDTTENFIYLQSRWRAAITARKWSLWRLCFHMHLSFCPGGGCLPLVGGRVSRQKPPPPDRHPPALRDTVNKWAVRIVECILVIKYYRSEPLWQAKFRNV